MRDTGEPEHRAGTEFLVERWAARLLAQRARVVVAVLAIVMVLRSGLRAYRQPLQLEIAAALPRPTTSYRGGAVISPILTRLLGVHDEYGWLIVHLVVVGIFLGSAGVLIWRRFETVDQRLFALTVFAASGVPVVALMWVGHYDIWLHIGAVVMVFGRTELAAFAGGGMIALTNTEQGVVALVTCAAVAAALNAPVLRRLLIGSAGLVVAWLAIRGWYLAYDVERSTRAGIFVDNLGISIRAARASGAVLLYSWFSASWLAVVSISGRALVPLLALPAAMTILTFDGTRVFVACSLPAFLVLIVTAAERCSAPELRRITGWTLAIMCVTPGLSTFAGQTLMAW